MKAFFTATLRSPKLAVLVTALVGAVLVPAALLAWGPDRTTYTMEHPADHVVFNSITNNPKHGDERNFVQISQVGGTYGEQVQLKPGKEYDVYVFYHNNASQTLNDADSNYVGIAKNAMMRVQMPASVKSGEKARFTGIVSASNAQPQQVWDEAYGTATADVALRYIPSSAKIHTLGAANGQTMPNSLFTTGANLGFDELDGTLPGCTHFQGYVVYRFKAVAPDFEIEKTVGKAGTGAFSDSINVKPGDTVEYKIQYKNTGSVNQESVVIKDKLPKGVSYIPGTTSFANAASGGKWKKASSNDIVTSKGINLGTYTPGSNVFVSFKAKIASVSKLKCGLNKMVNTAYAETDNGGKHDSATVSVNKTCKGTPPPPELPHTGMSDGLMATIGLSTFAGSIAYAFRSDRFRNLLRG